MIVARRHRKRLVPGLSIVTFDAGVELWTQPDALGSVWELHGKVFCSNICPAPLDGGHLLPRNGLKPLSAANGLGTSATGAARRKYRSLQTILYKRPLRPPVSWLYRGDRVTCPICEGTFRTFLPKVKSVGPNRRNAKCPRCGASERHRHLWLYLRNRTTLFSEPLRVLHFAPEWTIEKRLRRCSNLDYTSADLDPDRAMVRMDLTDIPHPDGSFDVALCSHVLEHVADDRKAMSELYRILKPGGWAIVMVPLDHERARTFEDPRVVSPEERERLFWQADHVRLYGRDLHERLEEAGFGVSVESYRPEPAKDVVRRYGLRQHDEIYLCSKPESQV
jgi:SAM-dependent methyltransferase